MNGRPLIAPFGQRFQVEQVTRIALAVVLGTLVLFYFWFGQQGTRLYDFGVQCFMGCSLVQLILPSNRP